MTDSEYVTGNEREIRNLLQRDGTPVLSLLLAGIVGRDILQGGHFRAEDKMGVLVVMPRVFDYTTTLVIVEWDAVSSECRVVGRIKLEKLTCALAHPHYAGDVRIKKVYWVDKGSNVTALELDIILGGRCKEKVEAYLKKNGETWEFVDRHQLVVSS